MLVREENGKEINGKYGIITYFLFLIFEDVIVIPSIFIVGYLSITETISRVSRR